MQEQETLTTAAPYDMYLNTQSTFSHSPYCIVFTPSTLDIVRPLPNPSSPDIPYPLRFIGAYSTNYVDCPFEFLSAVGQILSTIAVKVVYFFILLIMWDFFFNHGSKV